MYIIKITDKETKYFWFLGYVAKEKCNEMISFSDKIPIFVLPKNNRDL